jgi:hypothetical protein
MIGGAAAGFAVIAAFFYFLNVADSAAPPTQEVRTPVPDAFAQKQP